MDGEDIFSLVVAILAIIGMSLFVASIKQEEKEKAKIELKERSF